MCLRVVLRSVTYVLWRHITTEFLAALLNSFWLQRFCRPGLRPARAQAGWRGGLAGRRPGTHCGKISKIFEVCFSSESVGGSSKRGFVSSFDVWKGFLGKILVATRDCGRRGPKLAGTLAGRRSDSPPSPAQLRKFFEKILSLESIAGSSQSGYACSFDFQRGLLGELLAGDRCPAALQGMEALQRHRFDPAV